MPSSRASIAARGPGVRAAKLPADARRQQVLDVAIRVFAERGYEGASTLAIAVAAGVGEPTIYRHFASKRALFLAAFDRSSTELLGRWRAIAAESASPLEAIARIGAWYTEQLRTRPDDLLLRYRTLSHNQDAEITARVRTNYRETLAFVEDLYTQARERDEIDPSSDPRTLAWLFVAVGAALDQAQLLGLGDELTADVVGRIATLMQFSAPSGQPAGASRRPGSPQ
jgi:AcrR family transcriptional regulator